MMFLRAPMLIPFVLLVGCQPSEHHEKAPGQVQLALGPCTVDVQGIGEPYMGWVALKTDGSVWMNRPGGDANTTTKAKKVEELGNDVRAIANVDGESQSYCAVKKDNTLWCWGANSSGQVGDGSGVGEVNKPVKIDIPEGVASVGTGGWHACALTLDGQVYCWGQNERGQIGDGQVNGTGDVLLPRKVTALGADVAQISVGFEHSCALMKNGSIQCWGHNVYGEIGDGTSQELNLEDGIKPVPVPITSLGTDVAVLSAGGFFTCIIKKSDKSLWCWGDNTEGHLGTGDTVNRAVPTQSAGAGPWLDVDTGVAHGCGVKTNGSVWCWGRDQLGQLGTSAPTTTPACPGMGLPCASSPQAVQGISSGAGKISVKDHGACAVMSNGDLRCWGAGNFLDGKGQSNIPVVVDYCDLCEASDCSGDKPVCGWSGECETCTEDSQCPETLPACLESGHCAQCAISNSTACLDTPTPLCDPSTNECVGCITNDDCAQAAIAICDPETRQCRACLSDADCPTNAPACQANGLCGECSVTNLSRCEEPLSVCDPRAGVCVNCVSDADCEEEDAPYCDLENHFCRQCLTDDHCPAARPFCDLSGYYCSGQSSDSGDEDPDLEAEEGRYGACVGCATPHRQGKDMHIGLMLLGLGWLLGRKRWKGVSSSSSEPAHDGRDDGKDSEGKQ
jgi:alpha-tubulin suppressor-like RCC1 family protein